MRRTMTMIVVFTMLAGLPRTAFAAGGPLGRYEGITLRVSETTAGEAGNRGSGAGIDFFEDYPGRSAFWSTYGEVSDLSADGRYVVFSSFASNLDANDTNDGVDVFLKDTHTGAVTRVAGAEIPWWTRNPEISDDGRFVVFQGGSYVYVRDMVTGEITRIPTPVDQIETTEEKTTPGNGNGNGNGKGKPQPESSPSPSPSPTYRNLDSVDPAISGDGNVVAYTWANYSGHPETGLYVYNRATQILQKVDWPGATGIGGSFHPSLSYDGSRITYHGQVHLGNDVFRFHVWVKDLLTGERQQASINQCGNLDEGLNPQISGDGTRVVFRGRMRCNTTAAGERTRFEGTNTSNVYVRDLAADRTIWVSEGFDPPKAAVFSPAGGTGTVPYDAVDPSISADGRVVTFVTHATKRFPDDYDVEPCVDTHSTIPWVTVACLHVFVKDLSDPQAKPNLVTASSAGDSADDSSWATRVSADATHVVFTSFASNLVPADNNRFNDVFLRALP